MLKNLTLNSLKVLLVVGVAAPSLIFAQSQSVTLKYGDRGTAVSELQAVLKTDRSVYPVGSVSGIFGPYTQSAVKELQKKYGLPQTGIFDEATRMVVYPYYNSRVELTVLSPNGGENWNKNEIRTISWKATIMPVVPPTNPLPPALQMNYELPYIPYDKGMASRNRPWEIGGSDVANNSEIRPFFAYASLDLVRDSDPNFRQHIAVVNLYDTQYNWTVPNSIPDARDYRIQISIGSHVPCLLYSSPVACYPYNFVANDKSDGTFSINGPVVLQVDITKLKEQIRQLETQLNILWEMLRAIKVTLGI